MDIANTRAENITLATLGAVAGAVATAALLYFKTDLFLTTLPVAVTQVLAMATLTYAASFTLLERIHLPRRMPDEGPLADELERLRLN